MNSHFPCGKNWSIRRLDSARRKGRKSSTLRGVNAREHDLPPRPVLFALHVEWRSADPAMERSRAHANCSSTRENAGRSFVALRQGAHRLVPHHHRSHLRLCRRAGLARLFQAPCRGAPASLQASRSAWSSDHGMPGPLRCQAIPRDQRSRRWSNEREGRCRWQESRAAPNAWCKLAPTNEVSS